MRQWALILLPLVLAGLCQGTQKPDLLICDFEGSDYAGWQATGDAFGNTPARGTLPGQLAVTGFVGRGLVNSFRERDASTGTLTSPPFQIERNYIHFLIGGGGYPRLTCIDLIVDGRTVRTATGRNNRPGGSERLTARFWDVSDLMGKTARLRIVDNHTRLWGHITVDHIFQANSKDDFDQSKELRLSARYLNFPVKSGAAKRRARVIIDDRVVREFEIELADVSPDFYAFLDVSAFQGVTATIEVDGLPRSSRGLHLISQSDEIRGAENLYREKLRPQFHFTSRRGWNNDSNGLVFHKGLYHLYYQHNPYGVQWGNMHWGHAVSVDLVHWTELSIALYPEQFGDWCFSGSAVVDVNNTASFQKGDEPPIVAAYTSTGRGECIVYSNDGGLTFTEYEGNPVVKHQGRDPKVIWYGPGRHWVMALYHEVDDKRTIAFYTSDDLKNWQYASLIEGFYECPEIFELPVDGKADDRRCVLYAADGDYRIGAFDGRTFTPESDKIKFSHGNCFYASQTYSNIPPEDGRRIQVAWGRVETPGMPFNQMMLFPVELTLRTTEEGPRLFAAPVREIERLQEPHRGWESQKLTPRKDLLSGVKGELFRVRARFEPGQAQRVTLDIRGVRIVLDPQKNQLSCLDKTAPLSPVDGKIALDVLVDRTSIEIFANDGRVYMPMGVKFTDENRSLGFFCEGAPITVNSLDVFEIASIWP
ncbi:MAG: 2,6-beta-D-fructofuranosidase [Phycisphaerae bacterium]|nr:2,6-beta-D-fructofuranosidase [Phycisphaerae bacterium]